MIDDANEPAFARVSYNSYDKGSKGISKRFYTVCEVAKCIETPRLLVGEKETEKSLNLWAKKCYQLADALLRNE